MKNILTNFLKEEDGMGVVEVILIIIVLIGLVVLFKKEITNIVKTIIGKVSTGAKDVYE